MTTRISVQLIDDGMRKRLEAVPGLIDKGMATVAVRVEDIIQEAVAPHTRKAAERGGPYGALERSIFKRRIAGGWEVGHNLQVAPHARFVHDGTRPHVILPKKRLALRWPIPGRFAFAKKVNHPGYAGDAWVDRAARQAPALFNEYVAARLRGA